MARLVKWPVGLKPQTREPLSGPRAVNGAATQSIRGFLQTTASPYGLWRWRFGFQSLRGEAFRRYRGMVTALHGGANAVRVEFRDPDGLSFAKRGLQTNHNAFLAGQPWSNGLPWSNGRNWQPSSPIATVAAAAALNATTVSLDSDFWGGVLEEGDVLGFAPFHFGWYMVTQVVSPGTYRIWPPLRKALAAGDLATLRPVMVMRLESEEAAPVYRGAAFAENLSITLVEVLDPDVRTWFAD